MIQKLHQISPGKYLIKDNKKTLDKLPRALLLCVFDDFERKHNHCRDLRTIVYNCLKSET